MATTEFQKKCLVCHFTDYIIVKICVSRECDHIRKHVNLTQKVPLIRIAVLRFNKTRQLIGT